MNLGRQAMLTDEMRYKLMRLLEAKPALSQRDVARQLGVSVGRVNYCLQALARKGWIKAANFKNSHNKAAYMYLLTPRGIEQKAELTVRFLKVKLLEYEALRVEIEQMRREAEQAGAGVAADDTDEKSSAVMTNQSRGVPGVQATPGTNANTRREHQT
jgi:EPS-associated MarR family transcriptional regulator